MMLNTRTFPDQLEICIILPLHRANDNLQSYSIVTVDIQSI